MTLRNATPELSEAAYDHLTGRGDPQQRYRVYRLCLCDMCDGSGRDELVKAGRCPNCRGEGRTLELVATAGTAAGLGELILANASEGMFDECPIGILEDGGGWIVKPWLPSPRNISDAGRVLGHESGRKRRERDDGSDGAASA